MLFLCIYLFVATYIEWLDSVADSLMIDVLGLTNTL